jgi:hypothetical protein
LGQLDKPRPATPQAIQNIPLVNTDLNPSLGSKMEESATPSVEPVNCDVKSDPATASDIAHRADKIGMSGPSIVTTVPVSTKLA